MKQKKEPFSILALRLPTRLKAKLEDQSWKSKRTMSDLVREMIAHSLKGV